MAELLAKSPCDGLLPRTHGKVTLSEVAITDLYSVAPMQGQRAAVDAALKAAHGIGFPAPNRVTGSGDLRCIWSGRDQALFFGAEPDLTPDLAAVTDQSDAWVMVRLEGARVEEVLARLVPIDLRAPAFAEGHCARTLLQHMTVSISRVGRDAFEILAFRSMAATLVHDLDTALQMVAAR